MTSLEELEKKLYGPSGNKEVEKRMWRRETFHNEGSEAPHTWEGASKNGDQDKNGNQDKNQTAEPPEKPKSFPLRTVLFYSLGAALFLLLIAIGLFIVFYTGTRGEEARITFGARASAEAGSLLTIPILIENTSDSRLEDVEFALILPKGAFVRREGTDTPAPPRITRRLDNLSPRANVSLEYTVRLFGREREEQIIEGMVTYRPEGLRARFTARTQTTIFLERVPLSLSWELPKTSARGQEIEGVVRYASSGNLPFDNLALRIAYPSGFSFLSGEPKPDSDDAVWNLGTLDPNESGAIQLRGIITGEEGAIQTFRAGLGLFNQFTREWQPYLESSQETRIAVTPLSIRNEWAGSGTGVISGGEFISLRARFRNNTAYTLENISVRTELTGELLDRSTLSVEDGGVFDFNEKAIIWGPGSTGILRKLNPGDEGAVGFRVQVRSRPVVRGPGDYNQTIQFRTRIRAQTLPRELEGTDVSHEDALELKFSSPLLFSSKGLYQNGYLAPSGPNPPRVGQKTTYTIIWEVRNFTNDMSDALARATLPPNIRWEQAFFPSDARITFDAAAAEVTWNIGTISAGVGVVSPARVAAFQVSVTPADTDRNSALQLVNESQLTGQDTFTNMPVRIIQGGVYAEEAVRE